MTAVTGEVLILPLSDLGESIPLTLTSHLPPPLFREIQALPVYLNNTHLHTGIRIMAYSVNEGEVRTQLSDPAYIISKVSPTKRHHLSLDQV